MCSRVMAAPPDVVWSFVGDFASDWHPAIAACERQVDGAGHEMRVFEDTDGNTYRERLTYRSESDRRLRYILIEGIAGVTSYEAEVSVTPDGGGCTVTWSAEIDAPAERLPAIAQGTQAIFEAGLAWLAAQDFAPVDRLFCERSNPRLSWLGAGTQRAAPLVLFLHGIGGNAENWRAQLDAAGSSRRVAALDLRGYGDSALGADQTRVDDHCDDILRVMKAEGARSVILVGLSMGSWIATAFAMRHPDLLSGLVLAGGCTGMSEASAEERSAFLAARSEPLRQGKTLADIAPSVVDVIAGPRADASVREMLQNSMQAIRTETYQDALGCFCSPGEVFDFARIRCPVLMMTGEHDRLAPPEEIRAVSHRVHSAMVSPDVRFEIIGGAGHVCNVEEPEAFNRLLLAFLSRLDAAG